jgi:phosphoribosylformimino-5-aminoimidazole carboxamide ribotide isomerase
MAMVALRAQADKIILGADCNNEKIAISGWQEESDLEVIRDI